jgi:hypothetical protein
VPALEPSVIRAETLDHIAVKASATVIIFLRGRNIGGANRFSGAENFVRGDSANRGFYGLEAALRFHCIAVRTVAPLHCERHE